MKGTGLGKIGFIIVNKGNGQMCLKECIWSKEFYFEINKKEIRKVELAKLMVSGAIVVNPSDFTYLVEEDTMECRYCAHSETEDDYADSDRPILRLIKPCAGACEFIKKEAMAKFKVKQKWKRGRSHITIHEIVDEVIISQNKSGTIYTDSIYTAIKMFEAM